MGRSIMRRNSWTDEENEIIKNNATLDYIELVKLLPNRTLVALKVQYLKLGFKKKHWENKNRVNWSNEELKILEENSDLPVKELKRLLPSRSTISITYQKSTKGWATKKFTRFSERDIEFLRKYYPDYGVNYCAKILQRSAGSVECKCHKLKIKKNERASHIRRTWTNIELDILRENKHLTKRELAKLLPGRSINAISTKRHLIKANPGNVVHWTKDEVSFLKENYLKGSFYCSTKIGKSRESIHLKAQKIGLSMKKNSTK